MNPTPREDLFRRARSYLARIAIFDSQECVEPVDLRVADVRGFRSGGDDDALDHRELEPKHRVPFLPHGSTAQEAEARKKSLQSDAGDFDHFALRGGGIDLYRITAQLVHAVELWKSGVAQRLPEEVFDLEVATLPNLDERYQSLPKARAVMKLCGLEVKVNDHHNDVLNVLVWELIDGADWTIDEWNRANTPEQQVFKTMPDALKGPLGGYLDSYLRENAARRPQCPPYSPPPNQDEQSATADTPPPPPKDPDVRLEQAIVDAAEALEAAFGQRSADDILTDLRALNLPDAVLARLLKWIEAAWKELDSETRRFDASEAWLQSQGLKRRDQGLPLPRAWQNVRRLVLVLQFLGRLTRESVREVCIRLLAAWHSKAFDYVHAARGSPETWRAFEASLASVRPILDEAGERVDAVFRFAAMHLDRETYDRVLRTGLTMTPSPRPADRFPSPMIDPKRARVSAYYWRHVVRRSTLNHILALKETADFHVAEHMRFLGLFRPGGKLRPREGTTGYSAEFEKWISELVPGWFVDLATASVLRFKFSLDEPATERSDRVEMTFWSENHQVLFASSEYLAGQWWLEEEFTRTRQRGSWHRERAKQRLERWLHDRLRFGFSEVNSPVYYNYHLGPVLNLIDFVDGTTDEGRRIRTLALMVADILVFDIVRRTCQGSYVTVTSRVYTGNKTSGWAVSVRDFIEVATGTLGDFSGTSEPAAVSLATSDYLAELPECLILIAREASGPVIDRSRTSISFEDAERYGIGFESADDILFWWSHSAYFTEKTFAETRSWSRRWHLWQSGPFKIFELMENWLVQYAAVAGGALETAGLWAALNAIYPPFAVLLTPRLLRAVVDVVAFALDVFGDIVSFFTGDDDEDEERSRLVRSIVEQELTKLAIQINAGSVIEREHLYVWRSADAMLSSMIDEKKGRTSAQKEMCIASLGPGVSVFTTKPSEELSGLGGEIAEGFAVGLASNFAVWETIPGVLGLGENRAAPEIAEVAEPIIVSTQHEDLFGDGPQFFHGYVSNPLVWQHENVAIAIYRTTERQREVSSQTHAFWPWDHFDEVRTVPQAGGRWVFGRRDRRFPPRTPPPPEARFRPSQSDAWPSAQHPHLAAYGGAGYVALFSAQPLRTTPATPTGWGHKELIADGDDNIWITIVGDRVTYGSFDDFCTAVLAAKVTYSIDDGRCAITLPRGLRQDSEQGPLFEVSWDNGAKVGAKALSTDGWPRFEIAASELGWGPRFSVTSGSAPAKGRVDWDETSWRITAATEREEDGSKLVISASVRHDFTDLQQPVRKVDNLPPLSQTADDEVASTAAAKSPLGKLFHPKPRKPVGPRKRDPHVRAIR